MEVEKQNQGEEVRNPDWSALPSEILELFCMHLTLADQIRFGSVCKSWYSSASKRTYPAAPQPPWLVPSCDFSSDKYELFSILDQNKSYKIDKPIKNNNAYIAASFKGWLVIQADHGLYLQNLFSKLQIDLPPWNTMPYCLRHRRHMTSNDLDVALNFAMSICANKNPIMIALVTLGGDLALCKVGDKAWKGHQGKYMEYVNLTFHNAKLYVIGHLGKLYIFRVDDALQLLPLSSIDSLPELPIPTMAYLVESQRSLLVVNKFHNLSSGFEILKVEDDCDPPRLARVDSLNDQVLFLGHASDSLPAKDCAGPDGSELRGNHIYYFTGMLGLCHGPFLADFGVGVYSVEGRTQLCHLQYPRQSLLWVSPTFVLPCNCKCDCAIGKTHIV